MAAALAFLSGLIFGIGLIVAGMNDPAKVLGFLDFAGAWDPSLMLVMGAALAVSVLPFAAARQRRASWLGQPIDLPAKRRIDARLLLGSAIFGVGWGLSGLCPGPAVTGLGDFYLPAVAFTIAMVFGMEAFEWALAAGKLSGSDRDHGPAE